MDQQIFEVLTILFGVLITIIGTLVVMWIKNIEKALEKHQDASSGLLDRINTVANEVAKNYMPRTELDRKLDAIFQILEDIRKDVRHA